MNKTFYKFCIFLLKPLVRIFFPYDVKGKENLKKAILLSHIIVKDVQKYLDQAVSKGLIKSNTSDRQKSRLSNKVKNMK